MASKGRNGDSMLVHMTPGEVHGLQALAMKHGGSLTINPDTGLPEANFLKSLLPMLAGFALNAFVPGLGTAIGGALGTSAAVGTGIAVGGITGLATGSLSKGLMAGLGAYGGAGLSEGLLGAGAASGAGQTIATEAATQAGLEGITLPADYASLAAKTATPDQIAAARAAATPGDLLSAGAKSAGTDPMAFAKQNWKPIAAASLPILSEIGTTTQMAPASMSPGRIREKRWDGRQFVDVASTDAGVYNTSNRNFSDLYRGYNNGGIVALAKGGDVIRMAKGTPPAMLTDEQLYQQTGDWNKAAALRDQQNIALSHYNATDNAAVGANINKWITDNPFASTTDINKAITGAGLTQDIVNPYLTANTNISDATRYALSHATEMPGAGGLAGLNANILKEFAKNPGMNQTSIDTLQDIYKVSDADIQRPLSHGSQVAATDTAKAANYLATNPDVMAWINSAEGKSYVKAHPEFDANDIAFTHYERYGKGEGRKWEAPTTVTTVVGGGGNDTIRGGTGNDTITGGTGTNIINATQNTGTNVTVPTDLYTAPATSLPVGVSGNTGPSQIGGGATINPNGTITTSPRIPGIPVGGFAGMQNLRDTYTKGGGSLGYTSPKFDKIEDFNAKYVDKRLTGDSRAAYDYLTGKAGAAYPTKSGVGRISEAYDEAVLGYPARGNLPYIYNKATGKMDVNPDYVAPGRDSSGNVTYSMSLNDIKSSLKDTPLSGQALYDWAQSNNLSAQQIADATGRSLSSVYADFRAGSKAAATKDKTVAAGTNTVAVGGTNYDITDQTTPPPEDNNGPWQWSPADKKWIQAGRAAGGGLMGFAMGGATGYALGGLGTLGGYSDGGRLLKGPGDGVSDSIPATIGRKQQPARLADGEFVVPARIVSELGNGSTDAGAKKLYAMMDRVQRARGKTTGKNKVAANSRADKYLPA
jgi:hypothetical protein